MTGLVMALAGLAVAALVITTVSTIIGIVINDKEN
jgi:hypothetical protein